WHAQGAPDFTGSSVAKLELFCGLEAQTFSHAHEIRKRFSAHLMHDLSAVLLDGNFAVIKLESDLFVEQSLHNQFHYFAFLGRELLMTIAKFRHLSPIRARQTIAFERLIDRGQEFRITNGLG